MSLAGEPDGPPTKAGISYVDHSGGITAALGVCAALVERARTGIGTHVDLGLFDVQISMLTYLASWQRNRGADFAAHRELRAPVAGAGAELPHRRRASRALRRERRHVASVRRRRSAMRHWRRSGSQRREGRLEHRDEVIGRRAARAAHRNESRVGGSPRRGRRRVRHRQRRRRRARGAADPRPWAPRAERAPGVRPLRTRARTVADPGRDTLRPAPLLGEHTATPGRPRLPPNRCRRCATQASSPETSCGRFAVRILASVTHAP